MTLAELEQLSRTNIEETDCRKLVNIEDIGIPPSASAVSRMLGYLDQIKNPYCFLCGDTPVKICFSAENMDLGKKIKSYYSYLKR